MGHRVGCGSHGVYEAHRELWGTGGSMGCVGVAVGHIQNLWGTHIYGVQPLTPHVPPRFSPPDPTDPQTPGEGGTAVGQGVGGVCPCPPTGDNGDNVPMGQGGSLWGQE